MELQIEVEKIEDEYCSFSSMCNLNTTLF